MTALSRETTWWADLEQGTGAAETLPQDLRDALALATLDIAEDLARAERDRVEEEREQERAAERERQAAEKAAKVAAFAETARRRRGRDRGMLIAGIVLGATVLVPWGAGILFFKDTVFLPRAGGVFDTSARNGWNYFLPYYLMGLATLGVLLAAFELLRSWRGRVGWVVTGFVVLALAVGVAYPSARASWDDNERATVARLLGTPPGTTGSAPDCAGSCTTFEEDGHTVLYSARVADDSATPAEIDFYRGWQFLGDVTVAPTLAVTGDLGLYLAAGTTAKTSSLIIKNKDGVLQSFDLTTRKLQWANTLFTPSQWDSNNGIQLSVVAGGTLMVSPIGLVPVTGISLATGAPLWSVACPAPAGWTLDIENSHLAREDGPVHDAELICNYTNNASGANVENDWSLSPTGQLTAH